MRPGSGQTSTCPRRTNLLPQGRRSSQKPGRTKGFRTSRRHQKYSRKPGLHNQPQGAGEKGESAALPRGNGILDHRTCGPEGAPRCGCSRWWEPKGRRCRGGGPEQARRGGGGGGARRRVLYALLVVFPTQLLVALAAVSLHRADAVVLGRHLRGIERNHTLQ